MMTHPAKPVHHLACASFLCGALLICTAHSPAQKELEPDRVLNLMEERTGPRALTVDRGAPGLWQRLLKLQTTASALHTVAHPDDEQGGLLAYLSRGQGVRTALLNLNRGESGANAIGPELFDGLGLIRTEELLVADRYYGIDDQYFTNLVDYGYSKTLKESMDKWGAENVLRDMVRVVRINRPLVIISRFHGSERDGHGNHQTAGVFSQRVFEAAGDPNQFPEQISQEGLRPWQPLKMYRSNLRPRGLPPGDPTPPGQPWHLVVDAGRFSPWLGQSYQQIASLGLSFQRSQNSGRLREGTGSVYQFFHRVHSRIDGPERERSFFDGLDTSISGIFSLLGEEAPEGAVAVLERIEARVAEAVAAFSLENPSAVVPFLALGLEETRQAIALAAGHPDAVFMLQIKERQFMDAINTALGVDFSARAVPAATSGPGSLFAPAATMGVVVPGQTFAVNITLANRSPFSLQVHGISLGGTVDWKVEGSSTEKTLTSGGRLEAVFTVTTPDDAEPSRRYFHRDSIQDSRYKIRHPGHQHLPASPPALTATVAYSVSGQRLETRQAVYTLESNLPFGYDLRKLKVAPAVVVNLKPRNAMIPLASRRKVREIQVELVNNKVGGIGGDLKLEVPAGWTARPPSRAFSFAQAGERRNFSFSVSIPQLSEEIYEVSAVATAGGREYRHGYDEIRHRDYDTTYWYRDAVARVRGVDVRIDSPLKVGYVMGVGDEVPAGIEQLGADVTLLTADDLSSGDLSQYTNIVVGTRAYAVREDLITYNPRLLDYARRGGNLIVLYQTQEFVPDRWAAYPADLPRRAEEVSEEDSPVKILAGDHDVFNRPNQITAADFDHWVEQRGSKFFSQWDSSYAALIETQDGGQEPQRGGWLTARYGDGYYTYFAYAVHRQFPYGVAGAYRIFANLLSLGRR